MLTSGTKNTMLGGWGREEGAMHLYPGSLSEISGLLGVPVTFSEVKTIFRMTQRHDLSFSLCWHLHSWCKSNCAGASALIKAVAANGTSSHCILLHTISNFFFNKSQFPLQKFLMKQAVGIITFIKSWPLSTGCFDVLYDKTGSTHEALSYCTAKWVSRRKALV